MSKNLKITNNDKTVKIAILGSFTLTGLDECLKVKSAESSITYKSYIAPYNQYNQEFFNQSSDFYKFEPDITFLIIDIRSFFGENFYFPYNISSDERKSFVKNKISELENLIQQFNHNLNSKLVIANFNIPSYSPNGIIETKNEFSFHEMIEEINNALRNISKQNNSVYVYDFNNFISRFGEKMFLIIDNFILAIYKLDLILYHIWLMI